MPANDYKTIPLKHLLSDPDVLSLLEAVKEYPMSSIAELSEKANLRDESIRLSASDARTILTRLEISSQSQRVANFPKVLKTIEKIKSRQASEIEPVESAPEEIIPEIPEQPVETQPEPITDSKESAPQLTDMESILKQQSDKVIEELVVKNENSKTKSKKNALLPGIRFSTSPIYFVIIFLLLIALIYWLFTTQFYNPDSSLLQDSSLPVSP